MGKESFKILTLNNISVRGLERLPRDRYEVASEIGHPDAILLRSADMHEMDVPDERQGSRARRRRHEQHSGRAVCRSAAFRFSTHRAPTPTRSRSWSSPACSSRRATSVQAWEYVRGLQGQRRAARRGGREGQEEVRRLRAAGPHARCHRPRRDRRRSGQCSAPARHARARLRSADHGAARVAAVLRRRTGAVARRPVRALRHDHRARAAARSARAISSMPRACA